MATGVISSTSSASAKLLQLPNETLYCYNLNDKIKPRDLRPLLYELLCPYGQLLHIVIKAPHNENTRAMTDSIKQQRNPPLRGQAFVIFSDIASATNAMRCVQGRNVLGKVIHISFARTKSKVLGGSIKSAHHDKVTSSSFTNAGYNMTNVNKTVENVTTQRTSVTLDPNTHITVHDPEVLDVPTRTIFASKLPNIMTETALQALFEQFDGYEECRLIIEKGVGFIDFKTAEQADIALQALQGFNVTPEHQIKLRFANY